MNAPERRRAYRQPTGDASPVAVRVQRGNGATAEVVDASVNGVAVQAPAGSPLRPGEQVRIEVVGADGERTSFAAEVLPKGGDGGGSRFGLRLLERPVPPPGDPRAFHQTFNRRGAWRVPVSAQDDLEVTVRVGDHQGPALERVRLRNLSATGAGLLAPAAAAGLLDGEQRLCIDLRLAGCGAPIRLAALLRNRSLHGAELYFGVEFDADATADFLDKTEDIVGFVLARRQRGDRTGADQGEPPVNP